MDRERFASKMLMFARKCAESKKVNPIIIASQACLETGYGKSILSKKANNIIGIKIGETWNGLKYPMKVREFNPNLGWFVQVCYYRSYPTWLDCFYDYADILSRVYPDIGSVCDDPIKFLDRILPTDKHPMGISDPRYREKIISIAKKWNWL